MCRQLKFITRSITKDRKRKVSCDLRIDVCGRKVHARFCQQDCSDNLDSSVLYSIIQFLETARQGPLMIKKLHNPRKAHRKTRNGEIPAETAAFLPSLARQPACQQLQIPFRNPFAKSTSFPPQQQKSETQKREHLLRQSLLVHLQF